MSPLTIHSSVIDRIPILNPVRGFAQFVARGHGMPCLDSSSPKCLLFLSREAVGSNGHYGIEASKLLYLSIRSQVARWGRRPVLKLQKKEAEQFVSAKWDDKSLSL